MKKTIKIGFFTAILVLLWGVVLGQAVLAEPQEALTGEIILPVDIRAEGFLPDEPEVYTLVLEGEEGAPMPAGSQGQRFQWQVTGAQATTFPPIACNGVGIYHYTITQVPGNNAYCTYDETQVPGSGHHNLSGAGRGPGCGHWPFGPGRLHRQDGCCTFCQQLRKTSGGDSQTGESADLPLMLGLWVCSLLALALVWKQRKTV